MLERQIYINTFLVRIDNLYKGGASLQSRIRLISDILKGVNGQFKDDNSSLIDTKSNLNTDAIIDICTICGIDWLHFEDNRSFIDVVILRRRNAIAHGNQEDVALRDSEIDELAGGILALMEHFRSLLMNKISTKTYYAA